MSDIIFPAHELLQYSSEELKEILTGEFYLEFSDGELFTNDRETIFTSPLWDWIRKRPIPLKKHHHVSHHMQKRMFYKNIHMEILNAIHWDIYDHYRQKHTGPSGEFFGDYGLLETLSEEFYKLGNQHYNLMVRWMPEYITSISIHDVISMFDVPEIKDLVENVKPTEQSVLTTTRKIKELITKSDIPAIKNNRAVRMARAGVVKTDQLVQAFAPTGYIEDLGGEIFKYPLMSNYTDGHRSLYDSMVESRKASQALDATKAELEDAVYQSRRQEILNEIIMKVHKGDCGTKGIIPFKIRENNDLTKSDLELLSGAYYYDPTDKEQILREIKPTDKHLIGKVVHLRNITKCAHPDPNGVCECCLGAMSLTVSKGTNLGQFFTTDLYAFIIQMQLSKKHYMANSVVQHLTVEGDDAKYLRVGSDGVSYYFTEQMKNLKFKVIVSHEDGKSLSDIMYLTDVDSVAISRITSISSMTLLIDYDMYSDRYPVILGTGKRMASFSKDMLKYIKEKYWEIDQKDNFIIDMSDWDVSKPFAYVPMKNDSLIDFSLGFKSHIESDVKQEERRDILIDPDEFLLETFEMLNTELSINMAQVSVAVYGIMIRSAVDKEYGLPKPWSKKGIGVISRAMTMRSLSALLAYEKHTIVFNSTDSYTVTNRPPHLMDAVVFPELLPRV